MGLVEDILEFEKAVEFEYERVRDKYPDSELCVHMAPVIREGLPAFITKYNLRVVTDEDISTQPLGDGRWLSEVWLCAHPKEDGIHRSALDDLLNHWFELSYASFLTLPRLVMMAMPLRWQRRMADLLEEMDETFDWRPKEGRYWVRLRDDNGRFSDAPLFDYRHGSVEHLRIKRETPEEDTDD